MQPNQISQLALALTCATLLWTIRRDRKRDDRDSEGRIDAVDVRVARLESHVGLMWSIVIMDKGPLLKKPIHREMDDLIDKAIEQATCETLGKPSSALHRDDEVTLRELLTERLNDSAETHKYRAWTRHMIEWLDHRAHVRGEPAKADDRQSTDA